MTSRDMSSVMMIILMVVAVIIQKKNKRNAGHDFDTNKSFRFIIQLRLSCYAEQYLSN